MVKRQKTNNHLQNTTQKTNDWATHLLFKPVFHLVPFTALSRRGRSLETQLRVTREFPYVPSNINSDCETRKVLFKLFCILRAIRLTEKGHNHIVIYRAYERERSSAGTSARGPEGKECACESLKGQLNK